MASSRAGDSSPDGDGGFDVDRAYREHGADLFGFAFNATGDRADAEDCVQETFVRAWRARGRYRRTRASQRTWLFAIARNVVIDVHRTRARRPRAVEADRLDRIAVDAEDARVTERITLLSALSRLSREHRDVIVAVQLESVTYQELSERTGTAIGTLRSRMFYGMRALRDELAEEADHDA